MQAAIIALTASLIGGSLGAVFTTWLRNRHEREEAWRDRLADAADDFIAAATRAVPAIRDALHPVVTPEKVDALAAATDAAHMRVARVELLYEPKSKTAEAARLTVGSLRDAIGTLRRLPPDTSNAERFMLEADDRLRRFSAHAHAAMRDRTFQEPPTHSSP